MWFFVVIVSFNNLEELCFVSMETFVPIVPRGSRGQIVSNVLYSGNIFDIFPSSSICAVSPQMSTEEPLHQEIKFANRIFAIVESRDCKQ